VLKIYNFESSEQQNYVYCSAQEKAKVYMEWFEDDLEKSIHRMAVKQVN
jgi:hypothetical protein